MKIINMKVVNGEIISLYIDDNNVPLCPICGGGLAELPYLENDDPMSWSTPSEDICFVCCNQFGLDDMIGGNSPDGELAMNWEKLRIQWLEKSVGVKRL